MILIFLFFGQILALSGKCEIAGFEAEKERIKRCRQRAFSDFGVSNIERARQRKQRYILG